ncbi:MAG: CoA-binding protein [Gemmataceae bacterium]|nr:CoA-binding protein [Gemmataceae bacterium]
MTPRSITVVGASADRSKFGNKCVRAYHKAGWQVFPVHPSATEIEELPVSASVRDLPDEALERVSLYLSANAAMGVLEDLAGRPVGELWLNPGADDARVVARARSLGMPVVCACSIVDIGVMPSDLDHGPALPS